MGVPITLEMLKRSQRPSNDDLFCYFYDRTTEAECKSALAVESTGCCVTKIEYAQSRRSGECLDLLCSKNSYMKRLHLIHEFIQNKQGTADDGPNSKEFMVTENNVIFDTPQKPTKLFQFETPDNSNQELSQFKDKFLFLSPATQKFHNNIEKATKLPELSTIHGN
jgi:hypothetical protein